MPDYHPPQLVAERVLESIGEARTSGLLLEESEASIVNGCNRSNNQTKYIKAQDSVEKRFFEASLARNPYTRELDYSFYKVVGGAKDEHKCNTHGFPIMTHVHTYGFRHDSDESIHE